MGTIKTIPAAISAEDLAPWHERYGVATLDIGQAVCIRHDGVMAERVAGRVHAYASNHGKKFRTRRGDGVLYVLRIA